MAMRIEGEWYEQGFLQMLPASKCYVLVGEDENGLFDAETGDRLQMEEDGELIGWPCQTFYPHRNDLERLRGVNDPA